MKHHGTDERALIGRFRANGGELIVFPRRRKPFENPRKLAPTPDKARALSHLVRGHIKRVASGDFGWVMYRLKERPPEQDAQDAAAST